MIGRAVHRLRIFLRRAAYVGRYESDELKAAVRWLFASREQANFTYDLAAPNKLYLAELLAVVLGEPAELIRSYIRELDEDLQLRAAVVSRASEHAVDQPIDVSAKFGRRLGWYAIARVTKPKVIVETGVDKGLGAMALCAALRRNAAEGAPGRYFGTDILPSAGLLLAPPYSDFGRILYGDSLESLTALPERIDLFVNDSDHSADYEAREYEAIAGKLSPGAIILGDNAHATTALAEFSRKRGRRFAFFKEQPVDHWYPGAGIGISF